MASHGEEGHGVSKQKIDGQFKVVLIGDFKVGKSQILAKRSETYTDTTVTVEYETEILRIEEKSVKACIWGNVGQERYNESSKAHYEAADGVILVYDITNLKSFDCMTDWLKNLRNAKEGQAIILIGNKSDFENDRKVPRKEAEAFAKKEKLLFLEISKLKGTNFKEALEKLLKELVIKNPSAVVPAGNSNNNSNTNVFNNEDNANNNKNENNIIANNIKGNVTIQK